MNNSSNSSSTSLPELVPAVRLASSIEPPHKWPPIAPASNNNGEGLEKQDNADQEPKLIEFNPRQGQEGTIVTIVVQSLPSQIPIKLAFNNLLVETRQMQAQGITSLVATVPPFQQIQQQQTSSASQGSRVATVPLSICFLNRDHVATETLLVSDFVYTDTRGSSNDINMFQPKGENNNDFLNTSSSSTSAAAAYPTMYAPSSSSSSSTATVAIGPTTLSYSNSGFGSPQQQPQQQYHQYPSYQEQQQFVYNRYNDNSAQQDDFDPYISTTGLHLFNPTSTANTTAADDGYTNMLSSALVGGQQQPMYTTQQPPFQSTTTTKRVTMSRQSNSIGKSSSHIPSMPIETYQPYPGLVSRSNLEIMGDLESMTKNWSSEEWASRRRLVQFDRSTGDQGSNNDNKIQCTFHPISAFDYSELALITKNSNLNKSIVVSCIYWMERNEYYVTSVDAIYLLERLMDIKFCVEEKNRIRRNLEGFRPITVSKCKPESAEFFKLIMSFPNPKPRNIEKDVKAFPWKALPYALKKIVTKYTASSYGSGRTTAGHQIQQSDMDAQSSTAAAVGPSTNILAPMNTETITLTTYGNDPTNRNIEIKQEESSFVYEQQETSYAPDLSPDQPSMYHQEGQFEQESDSHYDDTTGSLIQQQTSSAAAAAAAAVSSPPPAAISTIMENDEVEDPATTALDVNEEQNQQQQPK